MALRVDVARVPGSDVSHQHDREEDDHGEWMSEPAPPPSVLPSFSHEAHGARSGASTQSHPVMQNNQPRRFQLLVGWFDEEHFPGCEAVHEQTVPSRSYERDGHRENCAVLLARFDGDRVERTELPFVHST